MSQEIHGNCYSVAGKVTGGATVGLNICALLLSCTASLQAQTPHISAVVNSATFAPGITLDSFGTVYGTGLSDIARVASVYPFPTTLGPTRLAFCSLGAKLSMIDPDFCQTLEISYASPTQINFIVPPKLALIPGLLPGGIDVIVSNGGVIDDGAANGADGAQAATLFSSNYVINPNIFFEGYDCYIDPSHQGYDQNCGLSWTKPPTVAAARGAITDASGKLITSSNPAHFDQALVMWATGYGPTPKNFDPPILLFNIPIYGYVGYTGTFINCCASMRLYPSYAGETAYAAGLDQINFQIPSTIGNGTIPLQPGGYLPFPCGAYNLELAVGLGGDAVSVPIAVRKGDIVGCTP